MNRKKTYFILAIVLSVILHLVDFVTDVQFTVSMRDQANYFNISIAIIIMTSVTNTTLAFILHNFQMRTHPNPTIRNKFLRENKLIKLLRFYFEAILGILQLEVLIAGINSIRLGKKTMVFAAVRYMEGIIESCPESLLQLFILLRLSGSISSSERYNIMLSLFISTLSLTFGVSNYEKWTAKFEGHYVISYNSKYFIFLTLFRFTEIVSRMALLACFGIALGGGYIFVMLLFDYFCIFISLAISVRWERNIRKKREKPLEKENGAIPLSNIVAKKLEISQVLSIKHMAKKARSINAEKMALAANNKKTITATEPKNRNGICWHIANIIGIILFTPSNIAAILGFPLVFMSVWPGAFTDRIENAQIIRFHFPLKFVEGLIMVCYIVFFNMTSTNNVDSLYLTASGVGIVCFVCQYIFLFYVLKWGSNCNKMEVPVFKSTSNSYIPPKNGWDCHIATGVPPVIEYPKPKKGDDDNSDNIPEYLVVTGSTFGAGQYNECFALRKNELHNGRPQFFAQKACIRWDGKKWIIAHFSVCPKPTDIFIYPPCCFKSLDESQGGIKPLEVGWDKAYVDATIFPSLED